MARVTLGDMETFVVRVWTSADGGPVSVPPAELRGIIEHIGSNSESAFGNAEELLALIRSGLESAPRHTGRTSPHEGGAAEE